MEHELHIVEERAHLFWGLIILVCTAAATYLLAGSFISLQWNFFTIDQLIALGLFLFSFIGIFKISDPLYNFTFYFEGHILIIVIKKGAFHIDTQKIPVTDIEKLKFSPHFPRSSKEALFDFSTTFHLMWKKHDELKFQKMLNVQPDAITLKVDDIAKIMRFISGKNPQISIPPEQGAYFNLS